MAVAPVTVVDRYRFTLEVWEPGPGDAPARRLHHCRVAVGRIGYTTPRGVFETGLRTPKPDWKAPAWVDAPLVPGRIYPFGDMQNPYHAGLISIHGQGPHGEDREGYALHGTVSPESIPGRASHGCVRLHDDDLLWLYDHLPDNALVVIC
jgi:lipoprotein-anchoring transpeptidase ErfK/SrfK